MLQFIASHSDVMVIKVCKCQERYLALNCGDNSNLGKRCGSVLFFQSECLTSN